MSHKDKICETAAATHIEICHPQCSYIPLVVQRIHLLEGESVHDGLQKAVDAELAQELERREDEVSAKSRELRAQFEETIRLPEGERIRRSDDPFDWNSAKIALSENFDQYLENVAAADMALMREELVAKAGPRLDASDPEKAIAAREAPLQEQIYELAERLPEFERIPFVQYSEVQELGLFFSEEVCYRCEALTYEPCGEEMTIMPGEKYTNSNTITVTTEDSETGTTTTSQELTSTTSATETDTFSQSYERSIRKETDISVSREMGFSIPFKVLKLDVDLNGSFNFNKIVAEAAKSSSSSTRKRFNEVKRELSTSTTLTRSRSVSSTETNAYSHVWENTGAVPLTYIRRQSWCKTSVIHKRTNVQLGWSGCIQNPGRDLCTPGNLEEKLEEEIKAIRAKWQNKPAPSEFGPRPANETQYTPSQEYKSKTGSEKDMIFTGSVPVGYTYAGNAAIQILSSNASNKSYIKSQPNNGATGPVTIAVVADFKNKLFHTERATLRVAFSIAPLAASDWDDRVKAWRDEQAEAEIEALRETRKAELEKFLASDQARAAITRRIMEDYFNATVGTDCCKLIKRLHRLFDFSKLCFSLYPAWNENGVGCQSAQPPTIYNASCLNFFLPIAPGMEAQALSLLGSIGAVPWSRNLLTQYLAYVQQINQMRLQRYTRAFDPTGWEQKFDQPKGYQVTPYDTSNPNQWDAEHETDLNFEVIDAFTLATPGHGFRVDPRPALCA